MKKKSLYQLVGERILVLDGAMGTMIQARNPGEEDYRGERFAHWESDLKGHNDLLSLTQPEMIRDIHHAYLEAGADIIETNTFNSNRISLADYHMEDMAYEMNLESARLARRAADEFTSLTPEKPRYVVGTLGPTNRTASLSPDVNNPGYRAISFEELRAAYAEQTRGLIDGGAEMFMVETVFDTLNAKAALMAVYGVMNEKNADLPVMVSGTITDASGRTLSGQTAEAFLISISHMPLFSVGFNCALGAEQLLPYVRVLSQKFPGAVSAHPNAGLPNAFGEYDQDPGDMAEQIRSYLELNCVNIIGGCCGTTPAHIEEISVLAGAFGPRKIESETLHHNLQV